MKTEWEKFEDLLNEIYNPPNNKSDRDIIILLGLYGEYITNWLLDNNSTKFKEISYAKIDQDMKLRILYELKKISESEYDVFDKLKAIRNIYAHKLELSPQDYDKIRSWMENIIINWDEKNEDPESLEKLMRKSPVIKFQMACLSKIGYLLTKIGIAKGEKINKIVIFDVKIGEETHKLKIM